ncbi:hypothetical protein BOTNAR_0759g00020 [Botryotinia narcissicola]|uniref:Uncharacterized protein n=1 Tax=Botryotinia narcissicola TaxID=278944 RepID=A0A4Z1H6C1_9HELO|nr:hypothetical protein BOTNAR_0759g00020 [Botryotinia narcissicola]
MIRWRMRGAIDPRDKVFALLGLIEEGKSPNMAEYDYKDDPTPGIHLWALDLKACPSIAEGYHPLHGYPNYNAASDHQMDQELLLSTASNGAIVEWNSSRYH